MDVRYTYMYDMNIIVNSLVYFEDVIVSHNVFETIGLQLVKCALEQTVWVHYGSSIGTKYTIILIIFITSGH